MIRRGMTRAQEERMRAENRRKEYQREDNKKLVAQERMMRANVACDERVENKRFIRRLQQVKHLPQNIAGTCTIAVKYIIIPQVGMQILFSL